MTSEAGGGLPTSEQIDSVAKKLETFAMQLPQQERQVLGWVIARASAASDEEVSGYLGGEFVRGIPLSTGFSNYLRTSIYGLGTNPAINAGTITWGW